MNFSDVIKEICESERITRRELSEITGISYKSIVNYSSGSKRSPSYENLQKMAKSPRLAKYRGLLLGQDDEHLTTIRDAEIESMINQLCEQEGGREQVLKALELVKSMRTGDDEAPLSGDPSDA